MFPRSFMNFDDDPFFSSHREHMRQMDRMMGGFGFGFGSPFTTPFGMLEGPQEERTNRERRLVHRQDPFHSIFDNMNSMMSQMHRNFESMASNPNGYSYSSSHVMSYQNDGRNAPKYFEASSATKQGPGGVKETQKTMRDSESGMQKMAIGHHIGDRGHVIEKSKNTRTETEEQKQDFYGIDEEDAVAFDREFKEKSQNFMRLPEYQGNRRQHHREQRALALEDGGRHREREGREKYPGNREKKQAEKRKSRKEKKVHVTEPGSRL